MHHARKVQHHQAGSKDAAKTPVLPASERGASAPIASPKFPTKVRYSSSALGRAKWDANGDSVDKKFLPLPKAKPRLSGSFHLSQLGVKVSNAPDIITAIGDVHPETKGSKLIAQAAKGTVQFDKLIKNLFVGTPLGGSKAKRSQMVAAYSKKLKEHTVGDGMLIDGAPGSVFEDKEKSNPHAKPSPLLQGGDREAEAAEKYLLKYPRTHPELPSARAVQSARVVQSASAPLPPPQELPTVSAPRDTNPLGDLELHFPAPVEAPEATERAAPPQRETGQRRSAPRRRAMQQKAAAPSPARRQIQPEGFEDPPRETRPVQGSSSTLGDGQMTAHAERNGIAGFYDSLQRRDAERHARDVARDEANFRSGSGRPTLSWADSSDYRDEERVGAFFDQQARKDAALAHARHTGDPINGALRDVASRLRRAAAPAHRAEVAAPPQRQQQGGRLARAVAWADSALVSRERRDRAEQRKLAAKAAASAEVQARERALLARARARAAQVAAAHKAHRVQTTGSAERQAQRFGAVLQRPHVDEAATRGVQRDSQQARAQWPHRGESAAATAFSEPGQETVTPPQSATVHTTAPAAADDLGDVGPSDVAAPVGRAKSKGARKPLGLLAQLEQPWHRSKWIPWLEVP